MEWETVIGLEIHAQLATKSKIFSGASTAYGAEPNTQACAVDLGLPGVLPVLNEAAVRMAIKFGLAIDAQIAPYSIFARKNYFYPDLPKGYQISQFELPVVGNGHLDIEVDGVKKRIGITRAHLEEDAGKSLHEDFHGLTGIDLNRAGTPLLEIVSEPDMRSAKDAVAYAKKIHELVQWIDICDGNMQEGSFRCDVNVSVHRKGEPFGTRREIKNLNSFRFMQQAIEFETQWQIDQLEDGRAIQQATVLFDPDTGITREMRSKEEANDYRYFPDPDLLPLVISEALKEEVRAELPELPDARKQRFKEQYALSEEAISILTSSRQMADYFEAVVQNTAFINSGDLKIPKLCANWVTGELSGTLNKEGLDITKSPVKPELLAHILNRFLDNVINADGAKKLFGEVWKDPTPRAYANLQGFSFTLSATGTVDIDALIEAKGLRQITDSSAIEKIIDQVIADNPGQVEQYRSGKDKVFGFFVGQVMKLTQGKANPGEVNKMLKDKLSG